MNTRTRRSLVAALLLGGALLTAMPAHAATYDYYQDVYDPVGSISVGRPCYHRTWTHIDTAAIPPARVVVDHYCTF